MNIYVHIPYGPKICYGHKILKGCGPVNLLDGFWQETENYAKITPFLTIK
jgi:hypothetical protein